MQIVDALKAKMTHTADFTLLTIVEDSEHLRSKELLEALLKEMEVL